MANRSKVRSWIDQSIAQSISHRQVRDWNIGQSINVVLLLLIVNRRINQSFFLCILFSVCVRACISLFFVLFSCLRMMFFFFFLTTKHQESGVQTGTASDLQQQTLRFPYIDRFPTFVVGGCWCCCSCDRLLFLSLLVCLGGVQIDFLFQSARGNGLKMCAPDTLL